MISIRLTRIIWTVFEFRFIFLGTFRIYEEKLNGNTYRQTRHATDRISWKWYSEIKIIGNIESLVCSMRDCIQTLRTERKIACSLREYAKFSIKSDTSPRPNMFSVWLRLLDCQPDTIARPVTRLLCECAASRTERHFRLDIFCWKFTSFSILLLLFFIISLEQWLKKSCGDLIPRFYCA